jgi:hypothetical protein
MAPNFNLLTCIARIVFALHTISHQNLHNPQLHNFLHMLQCHDIKALLELLTLSADHMTLDQWEAVEVT